MKNYDSRLFHLLGTCLTSEYSNAENQTKGSTLKPEKKVDNTYKNAIEEIGRNGLEVSSQFWNTNVKPFLTFMGITEDLQSVSFKIRHGDGRFNYNNIRIKLKKKYGGLVLAPYSKGATPTNFLQNQNMVKALGEFDKQLVNGIFCKENSSGNPIFIIGGSAIDGHIPHGGMLDFFINCHEKKKMAVILVCVWAMIQGVGHNAENLAKLTNSRDDVFIITSNWSYTLERAGTRNVINTKINVFKQKDNLILLGEENQEFKRPERIEKYILIILGSTLQRRDYWEYMTGYFDVAVVIIIVNSKDLDYQKIMREAFQKKMNVPYWKVICNLEDFIAEVTP